MCSGSKNKVNNNPSEVIMESEFPKENNGVFSKCSVLLELSASDDLEAFRSTIEEKGINVDQTGFWYGRRIGSKKMGFEERTPLMIAAMFGSTKVLKYIIDSGMVDVNRVCGSDKVTALHCATSGASSSSLEAVKLLLEASADVDLVNAYGNKAIDLLGQGFKWPCSSRRKAMEMLLRGETNSVTEDEEDQFRVGSPLSSRDGGEKKEYPIDVSLPDINNGMYGSDDFRMYSFKIKPCSRAYSHDWTECPFVHPGENARRRDPRKYPYSCVPCPEFRKGSCQKGDSCEYAHGVFESWLHPAQYRTRLCKDETGCTRKVCFFAHKHDELRPVYASTGSAMPSPRSLGVSASDMATLSPLALGPSSMPLPATSTPPMSPLANSSSPKNGGLWQNKANHNTPPALQLPGSRLKTALCARDLGLEMELLGMESHANQQQHQQQQFLLDEISRLSSPSYSKQTNLDDLFGSLDPSVLSQMQGFSLKSSTQTQLQSPTGHQIRQNNMNQLRGSYPTNNMNMSSSPVRKPTTFGFDSAGSMAAAVMNSRSSAFAKRSQSFVDRGAATHLGYTAAANSASSMMSSSSLSDWSSPNGKLDWAVQGDELNKLRKSASFGFRNSNGGGIASAASLRPSTIDEPDVSWVNSLVKDVSSDRSGHYNLNKGDREVLPPWVEQLYIEQEQMVA
ncbi:zinc finger CCCH domain-containing protein 29 [Cannabis sativa]|uniref:zinc finger CCCH domain-containing protein 29 n=1 Tax=Cannabis sativa TaxID=3483 RepID=UPI0029C9FAD2|nr:zinc finger CCCH domain-containing protein 29 [Cannabis sativa]XP_060959739.1 zinc finger CCCH domain-containing protein 29 [Cannabis sativa]